MVEWSFWVAISKFNSTNKTCNVGGVDGGGGVGMTGLRTIM